MHKTSASQLSASGSTAKMKRNVTQRNSSYFQKQLETNIQQVSYTEIDPEDNKVNMKSVKVKSRAQTKEPTLEETSHQEDQDISFQNNFIAEGRQQ